MKKNETIYTLIIIAVLAILTFWFVENTGEYVEKKEEAEEIEFYNDVKESANEEAERISKVLQDILEFDGVLETRSIDFKDSLNVQGQDVPYQLIINNEFVMVEPAISGKKTLGGISKYTNLSFQDDGTAKIRCYSRLLEDSSMIISEKYSYEYVPEYESLDYVLTLTIDASGACKQYAEFEGRLNAENLEKYYNITEKQNKTIIGNIIKEKLELSLEYYNGTPIQSFLEDELQHSIDEVLNDYLNSHILTLDDYVGCHIDEIPWQSHFIRIEGEGDFYPDGDGVDILADGNLDVWPYISRYQAICSFSNGDTDSYSLSTDWIELNISDFKDMLNLTEIE